MEMQGDLRAGQYRSSRGTFMCVSEQLGGFGSALESFENPDICHFRSSPQKHRCGRPKKWNHDDVREAVKLIPLFQRLAADIVRKSRLETVEIIITVLQRGFRETHSNVYSVRETEGFRDLSKPDFDELFRLTKENESASHALSLCLQTALEMKRITDEQIPHIEIAWTGPVLDFSGQVRNTFDIMKDMVTRAVQSVLLVGYSFTFASEHTKQIFAELARAKQRGWDIRLAVHDDTRN